VAKAGGAVVYVSSHKQKCMTERQTEAKLMVLMDQFAFVKSFHDFISFVMKKLIGVPVVHQDSKLVIFLITE
jgi:hypothetical protein